MLDRRGFLMFLGLAPLVSLVSGRKAEAGTSKRRIRLAEAFIAGFCHHEGMRPEVFRTLEAGDQLLLSREPDNPHDYKALAICTAEGRKLGYVPRHLNMAPAAIADQGIRVGAEIVVIDPDAPTWERVMVRVWEEV